MCICLVLGSVKLWLRMYGEIYFGLLLESCIYNLQVDLDLNSSKKRQYFIKIPYILLLENCDEISKF